MKAINLSDIKEDQTNQDRARAEIETYHARPDEQVGPSPGPVSQRRRLDVDAVLARSLRSVESEKL